ncbi:MAG: hypothetical protein ACI4AK_01955 [Lepagella sp.]
MLKNTAGKESTEPNISQIRSISGYKRKRCGAKKIRENPHNSWLEPPRSMEENSIIVAIIVVAMAVEVDWKLLRYR